MTASENDFITQVPYWNEFGVRLGTTRKAAQPMPAEFARTDRRSFTSRIRDWHAEHHSDGLVRKGKKPVESIYAIRIWSNPRFIKIGRSGRTGARFDIIRTSMPFYLEVLTDCLVLDAGRAEVALQGVFRDHCVCGEWFHFDEDAETEVVAALRECVNPPIPPVEVMFGVEQ